MNKNEKSEELLAIDIGKQCGIALFNSQGRLKWYRAEAFTDVTQLKKTVRQYMTKDTVTNLLGDAPLLGADISPSWMISRGCYSLAAVWERMAMQRGIRVQRVSDLTLHKELLRLPANHSLQVQKLTKRLALKVIAWSGIAGMQNCSSEEAKAIVVGLWGVLSLGWLETIPKDLLSSKLRSSKLLVVDGSAR